MWVTHRLLEAAASLTETQLRQSFAIGQGSIWKTLLHLQAAEYVWLKTLGGDETALFPGDRPGRLPGNQEGEGAIASLEELAARWRVLDAEWQQTLEAISPDSLLEKVYRVSTSSGHGNRFGTTRLDILLHVCTHAQYTVAQLVNMLRQAGASSLPDVMLITLARSGR